MIIELFGLPGAGKTYLSAQMDKTKKAKLAEINNFWERYFLIMLFTILHPLILGKLLIILIRENKSNKFLLKHKFKNLLPEIIALEQKARLTKIGLVDPGFFQFFLTIYERKITLDDLNWISKYFNSHYKILIIEADSNIRKKRMSSRGRIPRIGLGREYVDDWFEILEYNFLIIKDYIKNNFKYEIIKND